MTRLRMAATLLQQRVREYVLFDSSLAHWLLTAAALAAAGISRLSGNRLRALGILCGIHRGAYSTAGDRAAEHVVFRALRDGHIGRQFIQSLQPSGATRRYFANPLHLLGPRVFVMKSPGPREKGVLVLDYTALFPVVWKFFDLEAISKRYHIVLEPAWSGYCDLSILSTTALPDPVFVEAYEPRDKHVIEQVGMNLVVVPLSANWWVDHRQFKPLGRTRDIDVVMVASWASFKRHDRVFDAMRLLKERGPAVRASLVGYPNGMTREQILDLAAYYGVDDQVEAHEWLPPEGVNEQINRAKVNLIWSRREGVNRAIIEGMFAGIPCIVRDGFNYGYRYPYVNEQTGTFATEAGLPDAILDMIARSDDMSPRDWVMNHMSCERSTHILEDIIRAEAVKRGEHWSTGLAVRVCGLNAQEYFVPGDAERFAEDYRFLASQLRPQPVG